MDVEEKKENNNPGSDNIVNLVNAIDTMFGDKNITSENILSLCLNLMQLVEKFPGLKGAQKKELVLEALRLAISKRNKEDQFLLNLIPMFIDNVISLDNGTIKISVPNMPSCCGCFKLT